MFVEPVKLFHHSFNAILPRIQKCIMSKILHKERFWRQNFTQKRIKCNSSTTPQNSSDDVIAWKIWFLVSLTGPYLIWISLYSRKRLSRMTRNLVKRSKFLKNLLNKKKKKKKRRKKQAWFHSTLCCCSSSASSIILCSFQNFLIIWLQGQLIQIISSKLTLDLFLFSSSFSVGFLY